MRIMDMNEPRGPEAARLRQLKFELLRSLAIPEDALPGSLALTHRRCGKPTCHCAREEKGHPMWSLTFMKDGRKRVERIPEEWVEGVRRRVEAGRKLRDALDEIMTANARLLVLVRKEVTPRRRRR
jgi:hypothetical protein